MLPPFYTPEQYLIWEQDAVFRSEYVDGELQKREEASITHCAIMSNVAGELSSQLRSRLGQCYVAQMRTKAGETGLIAYPDIVVVGDEPQFWGHQQDVLTNPTLIVEVLSPTTEAFDRGEKFARFRRVASLTDYILVAQDKVCVEHYERQANGKWLLTTASDLADAIQLVSVGCELRLSDIYDKVDFPAQSAIAVAENMVGDEAASP